MSEQCGHPKSRDGLCVRQPHVSSLMAASVRRRDGGVGSAVPVSPNTSGGQCRGSPSFCWKRPGALLRLGRAELFPVGGLGTTQRLSARMYCCCAALTPDAPCCPRRHRVSLGPCTLETTCYPECGFRRPLGQRSHELCVRVCGVGVGAGGTGVLVAPCDCASWLQQGVMSLGGVAQVLNISAGCPFRIQ